MNKLFFLLCVFFIGQAHAQSALPGDWEGKLSVQGTELRIVFHFTYDEGYAATLDSPDQGAFAIPCGEVTLVDDQVSVKIPAIGGGFEGKLTSETAIEGYWSQGGGKLPLNLSKGTTEVVEVRKPQDPIPPYPYQSEEVSLENPETNVTLAGTLTIPVGDGPFPGAILVSGSGPQDRNEAILGHKPFLVLADYLTRNGIAVLRYDDRGTAASTGDFASATSEDFAKDAHSALMWLQGHDNVDPKRTGIIGHSEGGLIATKVAANYNLTGFIVLLAGPGVTGEEILKQQTQLIAKANGASDEEVAQTLKLNSGAFEIVSSTSDKEEASAKLEQYATDYYASLSEADKEKPGNNLETLKAAFNAVNTPWFRYFLTYDPAPALQSLTCPVLALNGEKDLQVPPEENLAAIGKALKKGKNKNFVVKELPGLNHLFQPSATGAPSEYGANEVTFSEGAMTIIAAWISGL